MSSFFRSPNDVTSSTTDDTEAEASASAGHERNLVDSNSVSRVQTLSSGRTSGEEAVSALRGIPQQHNQHRDLLLHSLLEDKALANALQTLNNTGDRPEGHVYSATDPEVKALAKSKYQYMANQLSSLGVLGSGSEDSLRPLRDRYRLGLDSLLESQDAGLELSDRSGPGALLGPYDHDGFSSALGRLAISQRPLVPYNMATSSNDFLSHPLQRLLASHRVWETSRYERDFEQISVLGKGGYGKVFKCHHKLDDMDYAIKQIVLSPAKVRQIQDRGESELNHILAEIRTIARLDHPNIVRYYGGWLEMAPIEMPKTESYALFRPHRRMIEGPTDTQNSQSASESSMPPPGKSYESYQVHYAHDELDVVFEGSHSHSVAETIDTQSVDQACKKTPAQRRQSNATVSSSRSKRSTVHSAGMDDSWGHGIDEIIPRNEVAHEPSVSLLQDSYVTSSRHEASNSPDAAPQLTLHIQMGVHPLTLAEFISPPSSDCNASNPQHCFHLKPSLRIILSIMDGVDYLHSVSVIHRDLKPSNIFLSPFPGPVVPAGCVSLLECPSCSSSTSPSRGHISLRIGDFGLVTAIARPDASPLSPSGGGRAVGTEFYRPHTAPRVPSEALDVFSLGVVLFELLYQFGTKMERAETLKGLKLGYVPWGFSEAVGDKVEDLVRGMTRDDEGERLSCASARAAIMGILAGL